MAAPSPDRSAAPPAQDPNAQGDYGHLLMLAQHRNMADLGRDVPFGIWAINTGAFRSIKADMKPYDYLETEEG